MANYRMRRTAGCVVGLSAFLFSAWAASQFVPGYRPEYLGAFLMWTIVTAASLAGFIVFVVGLFYWFGFAVKSSSQSETKSGKIDPD